MEGSDVQHMHAVSKTIHISRYSVNKTKGVSDIYTKTFELQDINKFIQQKCPSFGMNCSL